MRIRLFKAGKSKGIVLPDFLLAQAGLANEVDVRVELGAIVLRPVGFAAREGWAEESRLVAEAGDDGLV